MSDQDAPQTAPTGSARPDELTRLGASGLAGNSQDDLDDLADLEALAGELNALGCTALLLTPPGKLRYIDVGIPGVMTPGEKIHVQAGTFFWHAEPIGPSDQPAAAAATITHALLNPPTPPA
jgi:hypothetical protein